MRPIKFMAWDSLHRVMYGDVFLRRGIWFTERGDGNCEILGAYPMIKPMQSTGLHDKNGVEIYEGYVVRHDVEASGRAGEPKYVRQIGEVTIGPYGTRIGGWDAVYCSEREVIGNVYEHPHLIQKEV